MRRPFVVASCLGQILELRQLAATDAGSVCAPGAESFPVVIVLSVRPFPPFVGDALVAILQLSSLMRQVLLLTHLILALFPLLHLILFHHFISAPNHLTMLNQVRHRCVILWMISSRLS